jgi:AcrR family transcriptional regulator
MSTMTERRPSLGSADPRAERSRAALFAAAIELVSRAGSTDVSLVALAAESGLTRQAIYLHFPDRDSVLVAAAVDLLSRELTEPSRRSDQPISPLDVAEHFDRHRRFYAALMSGSCVGPLNRELLAVFVPVNERVVLALAGNHGPERTRDLALFLTGGTEKLVTTWMLSADPESPAHFAERLMATVDALAGVARPAS